MVYVKLLKDVAEGGVEFTGPPLTLKTTSRRNPVWFPPHVENGRLIRSSHPQFFVTPYLKDLVVTMHEESAKKWIKRGLCEIVNGPA